MKSGLKMVTPEQLKILLEEFKEGKIDEADFIQQLQSKGMESLEFAHVDTHRALRQGFPEVIFCEGKSDKQIKEIAGKILEHNGKLLATHADENTYNYLKLHYPQLLYHSQSRCIHSPFPKAKAEAKHAIGILTAGTSDIPVAEEAAITIRMFGYEALKIFDVGVAGIHRLNAYWDQIQETYILIVVAGMEGALPSVVGGLTDKPLIAVPTSVGYGTQLKGFAALFAMLNSCANNLAVVNIDNGFGAGYLASTFLNQLFRFKEKNAKNEKE